MIAVVMAGGRAARFKNPVEKGLLVVGDRNLLRRSLDALDVDGLEDIVVAVSPHTPKTRAEAHRLGIQVVETDGMGYHEDVIALLKERDCFLTLNVDVPFVRKEHVTELLGRFNGGSLAGVVPETIARAAPDDHSVAEDGSGQRLVWVGLNIVTPEPMTATARFVDPLLAVNVNDEEDLKRANEIAVQRGI